IEDKVLGTYLNLCNSVNYTKWHTYCDFFNMLVGSDEKAHYPGEYINLRKNCKKFSIYAIRGEVSFRDQCKGIIFWISPDFAAKIINKFRLRKFEKSL
ncbi:MAG: hypothetical protein Q4D32_10955, partial [Eubacteriales bacterium]|nr:hypothetical protein [Eubacteriales bacterium]